MEQHPPTISHGDELRGEMLTKLIRPSEASSRATYGKPAQGASMEGFSAILNSCEVEQDIHPTVGNWAIPCEAMVRPANISPVVCEVIYRDG
ncbi:hypothetical protein Nepgr_012609 [Nepenthes gracilis]|uniref:Uncharacterized protein n=1 Tax=Nepenthes gracilis TaxID=150966 RepID=A0AAD3XN89_NEPGR|nr:hypothetical protein Nepgr_012609 [Nepenthes gracilis]